MKGASAIGDTMQKLYQQNYMEQQDALKQQQIKRAYDLQASQFDFQKDRAGVQDTQWDNKFAFDKERFQTENEMKMAESLRADMRHQEDVAYKNKSLGLQERTANLTQDKANREAEEAKAKGLYYATLHPEVAKAMGYTIQQPVQQPITITNDPYGVQNMSPNMSPTQQPIIPQQKQSAPNQIIKEVVDPKRAGAMAGIFDKVATKENDPYKDIMASIAGDKATTYKTNEEEKRKLEAERIQETKVKNLKTALYNDPKSVLGIDPSKLTDESRALFFDDVNKGLVGKYEVQKRDWLPDQNVYIPFSQPTESAQPTQQQIKIIPHTEAKNYSITFE